MIYLLFTYVFLIVSITGNKTGKYFTLKLILGLNGFKKQEFYIRMLPKKSEGATTWIYLCVLFSGRLHIYSLGFVHVIFVEKLNTISETTDCSMEDFGRN